MDEVSGTNEQPRFEIDKNELEENLKKIHKVYMFSSGMQVITRINKKKAKKGVPRIYWEEPLVIILKPDQAGKMGMMFQPFPPSLYTTNSSFGPINEKDALFSFDPDQSLIEGYEQQTLVYRAMKAGIMVAPAGADKNLPNPPPGQEKGMIIT